MTVKPVRVNVKIVRAKYRSMLDAKHLRLGQRFTVKAYSSVRIALSRSRSELNWESLPTNLNELDMSRKRKTNKVFGV